MVIVMGASTPKKFNLFSWLIRKYDNQKYSHVFVMYLDNVTKIPMVIEASNGYQHLIEINKWHKKNKIIKLFEIDINEKQFQEFLEKSLESLQTKYSIKNIIGILFYDIYLKYKLNFFLKIANLFIDGKNGLICSESTARIAKIFNIKFDKQIDFIKPIDVIKKLSFLSLGNNNIRGL